MKFFLLIDVAAAITLLGIVAGAPIPVNNSHRASFQLPSPPSPSPPPPRITRPQRANTYPGLPVQGSSAARRINTYPPMGPSWTTTSYGEPLTLPVNRAQAVTPPGPARARQEASPGVLTNIYPSMGPSSFSSLEGALTLPAAVQAPPDPTRAGHETSEQSRVLPSGAGYRGQKRRRSTGSSDGGPGRSDSQHRAPGSPPTTLRHFAKQAGLDGDIQAANFPDQVIAMLDLPPLLPPANKRQKI